MVIALLFVLITVDYDSIISLQNIIVQLFLLGLT